MSTVWPEGSQRGTGTRETEVRLDGRREDGIRQRRNAVEAARKIGKSGELWYICN